MKIINKNNEKYLMLWVICFEFLTEDFRLVLAHHLDTVLLCPPNTKPET
jgi:hypothetical protein